MPLPTRAQRYCDPHHLSRQFSMSFNEISAFSTFLLIFHVIQWQFFILFNENLRRNGSADIWMYGHEDVGAAT